MWAVRSLLTIVLVLCVVAFAYYNSDMDQRVSVNLIWVKYVDMPLITVVFWSFVAGVFVSLFVFVTVFVRQSVQIRATRRRLLALESEVTVLRNRPIEESADLLKSAVFGQKNKPALPELVESVIREFGGMDAVGKAMRCGVGFLWHPPSRPITLADELSSQRPSVPTDEPVRDRHEGRYL